MFCLGKLENRKKIMKQRRVNQKKSINVQPEVVKKQVWSWKTYCLNASNLELHAEKPCQNAIIIPVVWILKQTA